MAKVQTGGGAGVSVSRKPGKRLGTKPPAGGREDALRILMDDDMMRQIAKIGCFRVLHNEPVVAEPPDPRAGRRLYGIEVVDYASDRSVSACVDLDRGVSSLRCAPAQARLAPEEESEALRVALADRRVAGGIALGDEPQSIHHVETRGGEHRSAAVVFAAPRCEPSLIAVVDLARNIVTKIVPTDSWKV